MNRLSDNQVATLLKKNWSNYCFSIVALITIAYLFLFFAPRWSSGSVVYWLETNSTPALLADRVFDYIPLLGIILLITWFLFGKWEQAFSSRAQNFVIPLMISLFCLLAFMSIYIWGGVSVRHLNELQSGNHIYRVAYDWTSSDANYLVLFECGSFGILCRKLCRVETDGTRLDAAIRIDETHQRISIMDGNNEICHSGNDS